MDSKRQVIYQFKLKTLIDYLKPQQHPHLIFMILLGCWHTDNMEKQYFFLKNTYTSFYSNKCIIAYERVDEELLSKMVFSGFFKSNII